MVEILLDDKSSRVYVYKLLSDCYYAPDEGLINSLTALQGPIRERFSGLLGSITKPFDPEGLKVDYAKLFLGPYKVLAPPYGSVYLETNGRLMGESTVEVRNCYRKEGLDLALKEIPDHIAVELEFMHFLSIKELEALKNSDSKKRARYQKSRYGFLTTYLSNWIPEFCKRVQANAQTEFYKSLSQLTRSFIQDEVAKLS